jgi:hypothetical protein
MRLKILLPAFILVLTVCSFYKKPSWRNLLDKDLSQWEMYLSYRHQLGYNGQQPVDDQGVPIKPIGYNNNVNNVFSVIDENGEPVLRVSGEIYGCVFTKEEFENYHLKLKVKWGEKKWIPRLDEYKDSGILYHSQGECGVDYWRSWMLSQEFQIIEKGMGDFWPIANSQIDIKIKEQQNDSPIYSPAGTLTAFGSGTGKGHCLRAKDVEKPHGEWNTLELICYQDKSIYIVNDEVVMTLSGSRYKLGDESKPLTKGKIQLQSEAAEVFFKEIQIRNIESLPREYAKYFK